MNAIGKKRHLTGERKKISHRDTELLFDVFFSIKINYYNGELHYAFIPALGANTTTAMADINIVNIQRAGVDTYWYEGAVLKDEVW